MLCGAPGQRALAQQNGPVAEDVVPEARAAEGGQSGLARLYGQLDASPTLRGIVGVVLLMVAIGMWMVRAHVVTYVLIAPTGWLISSAKFQKLF